MCTTCTDLEKKIAAAEHAGDYEKARVLRVIYNGHRSNTCHDGKWAAILWKNGQTWKVGKHG